MKKYFEKAYWTEQRIRKAFIFLVFMSLFFPLEYYIVIGGLLIYWAPQPLLYLVLMYWGETAFPSSGNLNEILSEFWTLFYILSIWSGPILAFNNLVINGKESKITKFLIWFNMIMAPIFIANLIDEGWYLLSDIKDFGYSGYVFVIFLGFLMEVYLYIKKKGWLWFKAQT